MSGTTNRHIFFSILLQLESQGMKGLKRMRPPQGKDTTVIDIFHEKNVVLRKLEKTMCLQHYLFLLALKASIFNH